MILESALVVPVPEAEPIVAELRARYDPTAPSGLPAHITVVYPYLQPAALTQPVLGELSSIFAGVAPFRFTLQAIARFPEVVYLVPDPTEAFSRLTAAITTRWPEAPPYGGIYDEVVPHLTVAHTSVMEDIEEIRKQIGPHLPLSCEARQVWLMTNLGDQWSLECRFALDGLAP